MSMYFSVYDYGTLPQEGKDLVDAWFFENNIDPMVVTLIEGGFEDETKVVVSGIVGSPPREAVQDDIKIIRTLDEDTFPWEQVIPLVEEAEVEEIIEEGVASGSET